MTNNQKDVDSPFGLSFDQLVIGELVILFFTGHWDLITGHYLLH
jgi:hypothetical protein